MWGGSGLSFCRAVRHLLGLVPVVSICPRHPVTWAGSSRLLLWEEGGKLRPDVTPHV